MSSTYPNATALRPTHVAVREGLWWTLVVGASILTGWVTLASPQLGCTVAVVTLGAGLYVANRAAGLAVVWLLWLHVGGLTAFGLFQDLGTADRAASRLAPRWASAIVTAPEAFV